MNKKTKNIISVFILLCFFKIAHSQNSSNYITIVKFDIEGNDKTREGTILRELDFQLGDSILLSNLANRLGKNQTLLLNTGLFFEVELNVREWDAANNVSINIKVREAWYIYPIPIFDLADRNFNVWWKQYNHSFKRIDYGVRLYYANVSGRRDILKGTVQLGFTQKYELDYSIPFINQAKTIGLNSNFLFTRNKEIGLQTTGNDLIFFRDTDERVLLRRYRFGIGMTYRPKLYQRHKIETTYFHRIIEDSVHIYNPDFFLEDKNQQQFFSLSYTYQMDKRDIAAYPLKGYFFETNLTKEGFGIFKDRNAFHTTTSIGQYSQLGKNKKYSISLFAKGRLQFQRQKPPYYNNHALGYEEDFIRGYEFYVIDGLDYAYLKSSIRYEIFNKNINWKKAMPFKSFKIMPFRMYLSINSDFGYANDPHYKNGNPLTNEFLWGGGIGLDFIIYVDKVIQVEYSTNRLGEKGVYLHYRLFF